MLDDATFRDSLNSAADDLIQAFRGEWRRMAEDHMMGRDKSPVDEAGEFVFGTFWPSSDDNPFDELPGENLEEFEEYVRNLYKQFRGHNISGGTAIIHGAIVDYVSRSLREIASDEFSESRPTDVIASKLADWDGAVDSAAYRFTFEYLPKLRSALVYQLDVAESLEAIIKTHEGIVLAARESILGIADQTLAALGHLQHERSTRDSAFLKSLATDAISILLSVETDPAKVVRTTLSMVGDTLVNSDLSVGGSGLVEVVSTMESAINNLVVAIIAEETVVRDAIASVHEYVSGDFRLDVLPLDVNRPEPWSIPIHGPL
jgi:hypothetical protein